MAGAAQANVRRQTTWCFGREATMARMNGVEPHQAGWSTRIVCLLVRRSIGEITGSRRRVEPVKITAHHSRLLKAYGWWSYPRPLPGRRTEHGSTTRSASRPRASRQVRVRVACRRSSGRWRWSRITRYDSRRQPRSWLLGAYCVAARPSLLSWFVRCPTQQQRRPYG